MKTFILVIHDNHQVFNMPFFGLD